MNDKQKEAEVLFDTCKIIAQEVEDEEICQKALKIMSRLSVACGEVEFIGDAESNSFLNITLKETKQEVLQLLELINFNK